MVRDGPCHSRRHAEIRIDHDLRGNSRPGEAALDSELALFRNPVAEDPLLGVEQVARVRHLPAMEAVGACIPGVAHVPSELLVGLPRVRGLHYDEGHRIRVDRHQHLPRPRIGVAGPEPGGYLVGMSATPSQH